MRKLLIIISALLLIYVSCKKQVNQQNENPGYTNIQYTEITLSPEILKQYTGIYEINPSSKITITSSGSRLYTEPTFNNKYPIYAMSETKFFYKGINAQIEFFKNNPGEITHFVYYMNNQEIRARRISKKIIERKIEKKKISLPKQVLDQYAGVYKLMPSSEIRVASDNGFLIVKATGQQKATYIFANSATLFYSNITDSQFEFFKNNKGEVTHLVYYQSGQIIKAEREKEIIVEKAPFPGYLYRPKDDAAHPGIILLHGSSGGNGDFWHYPGTPSSADTDENYFIPMLARYYAGLGYCAYALCYFDCSHHEGYGDYPPDELKNIDLLKITYKAFNWLKNSDYVKNKKVAIWGVSRGAEQVLVFASLVGKNKESMKLTVPDAILAISPSDFVAGAFTREMADYISNYTEMNSKKPPKSDYSSWIFDGKKIKPGIPVEIGNYKGPVLITYFTTDTLWEPSVRCDNLFKRYSENNIPYVLIPFSAGDDAVIAVDKARKNMDKNIFINFDKGKGHGYPVDGPSCSVMNNVIELFLKTHLGN
jgi:hypothetical protein